MWTKRALGPSNTGSKDYSTHTFSPLLFSSSLFFFSLLILSLLPLILSFSSSFLFSLFSSFFLFFFPHPFLLLKKKQIKANITKVKDLKKKNFFSLFISTIPTSVGKSFDSHCQQPAVGGDPPFPSSTFFFSSHFDNTHYIFSLA